MTSLTCNMHTKVVTHTAKSYRTRGWEEGMVFAFALSWLAVATVGCSKNEILPYTKTNEIKEFLDATECNL